MVDSDELDQSMTLDEVAGLLDTSPAFVAQLVARDAIPYERSSKPGLGRFKGDQLRFRRDEIQAWLKAES
jgi:hypothetical protein